MIHSNALGSTDGVIMKQILAYSLLFIANSSASATDLFNWNPNTPLSLQAENIKQQRGIGERYLQGKSFQFNKATFNQLTIGDTFAVNLPKKPATEAIVTQIKQKGPIKHIIAQVQYTTGSFPIVLTLGDKQFFMRIVDGEQVYVAQGHNQTGALTHEANLMAGRQIAETDVLLPPQPAIDKMPNSFTDKHRHHMSARSYTDINSTKNVNNTNNMATVDVLFVHGLTQEQIDQNYGGDVNTRIQHIIEVTNQIYLDSNVNIQIAATEILAVDYPIDNDSSTALNHITDQTHEAFTDIENIRFQQGADMVALLRMFVDGDDACGLAWANSFIPTSENYMYSHTSIDCGDYVNAHELGHNMGLAHSRAQGDTGYTFPYALGHRIADVDNGFSTVMAYTVSNAPKIFKFSNPDILCTQLACGVDRNDPTNGADATYALNQVNMQLENLFDRNPDLTLASTAITNIADVNLQQCIQSAVNSSNIQYVGQLKQLICRFDNISSLAGIDQFTALRTLNLNNNNISDLSPLTSLTGLWSLSAANNPIADFSPISSLSNLYTLDLINTGLTNLTPFAGLTQLYNLFISSNQVSDLTPLSNLQNLNLLDANNNNIQSLVPISQLSNLQQLSLTNNQISDIAPLSSASALLSVFANDNNIASIDGLSGHQTLTTLSVADNNITNLTNFKNLPQLSTLRLSNNGLTTWPTGTNLPSLSELLLNNNNLSNVSFLSEVNSLGNLNLSNNPISNINTLINFPYLHTLSLGATNINNVSFVSNYPSLVSIDVNSTSVSDISAMRGGVNLTTIDIGSTLVADVSPLFEIHAFWNQLNFSGANAIYCWQLDYIDNRFNAEFVTRPNICSTSTDANDFDSDGMSNRDEIDNGSNPVYHNSLPGQFNFQVENLTLIEEGLGQEIRVIRSVGEAGSVSVNIVSESGSARAGTDFQGLTQTLTFANGEHVKRITLNPINDDNPDSGKTFTLTLENAVTGEIGEVNAMTVTILDSDAGAFKWQSTETTVAENAGSLLVTIEQTGASDTQASVDVRAIDSSAVNGSDYNFTEQTVIFEPGEISKTISVDIIDDALFTGDDHFFLELTNAVDATISEQSKSLRINIEDNDAPAKGEISFSQSATSVQESAGELTLTLVRSNGSFGDIDINFQATDGSASGASDYTLAGGSITFADGEVEKTITVNINDDSTEEANETFTVSISAQDSSVIGTIDSITVTITDNDETIVVTPPSSASGGGGGGAIHWLYLLLSLSLVRYRNKL